MRKTCLLLALVLVLASFGVPAQARASEASDLLMGVQTVFADAPAVSFDMAIASGITLGEQTMDFTIISHVVVAREPAQMKIVMDMSAFGLDSSELYVVSGEEGYARYQKDSGQWSKLALTDEEAAAFIDEQTNSASLLLTFGEDLDSAEMLPDENVNDIACKVIKQMISGERLASLAQANVSSSASLLSEDQISAIYETMGASEAIYYINAATGELVKVSLDMSEAYLRLIAALATDETLGDEMSSLLGMTEITKMVLEISVINVGEVEAIEVPAEAY